MTESMEATIGELIRILQGETVWGGQRRRVDAHQWKGHWGALGRWPLPVTLHEGELREGEEGKSTQKGAEGLRRWRRCLEESRYNRGGGRRSEGREGGRGQVGRTWRRR